MPQDTASDAAGTPATVEMGPANDKPAPNQAADSASVPEQAAKPALAPLTPQEFRIYNRLAEQMDYFHDHFRQMYATLHTACTTNRRPANMSLKQFVDEGLRLARYLEMHHSIEETHLYPLLGRKMPEFRASSSPAGTGKGGGKRGKKEECELLRQHQIIHDGMDEMADYLRRCKDKECELDLGVLRSKVEPWGDVLLKHLDQEVRELGAEKMRKYYTLQEMKAFPI
ncbi:hypothetical protein MYCTH_2303438 [Thermothelomyces thermophilus ATCC 42464]|uniref:Hemerythrin-like domain-containing protein n=1 Tax=Thermothelomyces thermophilus (strain ATCC 42464 / BCRC 31852 / DSM 1799) TaxID=573729 RepID=G2QCP5_THET4|nr:uncharacterized protein MYCTH_2303438 [Thermothelomyces thermophilus ATCC 42464]AEO57368.1 hypothetical protein MYCTH_2303438 [Thermothelomyces thermophilus ATCC 42464]